MFGCVEITSKLMLVIKGKLTYLSYYCTMVKNEILPFFNRKMDIERLIEEVRKHPVLYDQSDQRYRNSIYKDRIWNTIASKLGARGKFFHKMLQV